MDNMPNELMEMILDKDKTLKDTKASNHPEDWARARRLRNHIKHIIKRARANYIRDHDTQTVILPKSFGKK